MNEEQIEDSISRLQTAVYLIAKSLKSENENFDLKEVMRLCRVE